MSADVMSTLPTPICDAASVVSVYGDVRVISDVAKNLERDAMTMALRLYGENPDTFSPETRECMDRWAPRVRAGAGCVGSGE